LIWRAAIAVEEYPEYDDRRGTVSKVVAADTAVFVWASAAELHRGQAVSTVTGGVEKCLRDCLSFLHSDGAQDTLALRLADIIAGSASP